MSNESRMVTEIFDSESILVHKGGQHHVVPTSGLVYTPSDLGMTGASVTITPYVKPYAATPEDFSKLKSESPWDVNQNEYVITMSVDMPGIKKDEVKVLVTDSELLITATAFERYRNRNYRFSHRIPHEADIESASSVLEHGVLTVTFKRVKRVPFVNVPVK